MAVISQPFSSANTTVDIFGNSTTAQQGFLNTLRSSLATAMALALTDPITAQANKVAAFNAFASASGTVTATALIVVTGGAATPAAQVEGYYSGTFAIATGGAVAGTWYSVAASSSSITAVLVPSSGTFLASQTSVALSAVATTSANTPTTTALTGSAYTSSALVTGSGSKIGKITAIGDTGVEVATIEVKLLNESGTSKDTGSSNEGTTTIDFLDVPADEGQLLMFAARDDRTSNKNRVFKLKHNSSGQVKWFVGIVSQIKTTEGAVDAMQTNKATILIQDGLTIVNPV